MSARGMHAPEDWVPVERRILGLDRRTILPALVVWGLVIVMTGVLPAIDRAIAYDDEVEAGDVIELRDGVTFVPTPGWGITDGTRVGDEPRGGILSTTGTVEHGAVAVRVVTGPFTGSAEELLDQLDRLDEQLENERGLHSTGPAYAVATSSGIRGVLKRYTGTKTDGALAAFVVDGVGIQVVVTGPPGALDDVDTEIAQMIASVSHAAEDEGT